MDMLYGATFQLDAMPDAVLQRIDDFFGPLNLQTVEQVIAFAREHVVTDREGNGSFMVPSRVATRLKCPVLCLHSANNGLVDFRTRRVLADLLAAAGVHVESVELSGMGHQDSLIGSRAGEVYARIADFLGSAGRP
jgi:acetyl esterase/lipase